VRPFLAIDCGTTNTRVWLIEDGEVTARAEVMAGVRDTARTGSTVVLRRGIAKAIGQASSQAGVERPTFALAAGMITSNLGLVELPHAPAPAGVGDLSESVERVDFSETEPLTVYFVRGVRTGQVGCGLDDAPDTDIIRGEETEVFGALEMLGIDGPLLYVHLGSHTKIIRIDSDNRIDGGATTLAGELDHVVRSETILSSALPPERTEPWDDDLLDRGAEWAERYGLSRTFFLIRILEQSGQYNAQQLGSVFAGALAFGDIQAIRGHGLAEQGTRVILSGRPRFQSAWRRFLEREGFGVTALTEEQIESAFLTGLQKIVFNSPVFQE
jgi:2-dehydro-3-deoxygalactonokinase